MCMKKMLSFGLEPYPVEGYEITHIPLIEVVPLPMPDFKKPLEQATHLILTSKTAVDLFPLCQKKVIAVGKATAARAIEKGFSVVDVAKEESQEGIVDLIQNLARPSLFWPRSELARPLLSTFCDEKEIPLFSFSLYTLYFRKVILPPLQNFDALYFSSASTVDAFLALKPCLPHQIKFFAKGVVTKNYIDYRLTV